MGQPRPLFVYFRSFQTNNTIFTTNQCEKCPSSIWCWDLNPRPLENESSPIITRPGFPPNSEKCSYAFRSAVQFTLSLKTNFNHDQLFLWNSNVNNQRRTFKVFPLKYIKYKISTVGGTIMLNVHSYVVETIRLVA